MAVGWANRPFEAEVSGFGSENVFLPKIIGSKGSLSINFRAIVCASSLGGTRRGEIVLVKDREKAWAFR